MADNVTPMPPRLPPPVLGTLAHVLAHLEPGEAIVGCVVIRDSARVTIWYTDIETEEHWDWLEQQFQSAWDTMKKSRADDALRRNQTRSSP
jgi:hypothetical protein